MTIWPRWMDRTVRSTRPVTEDAGCPFPHDFLTGRLPSVQREVTLAGRRVERDGPGSPGAPMVKGLVRNFPVTQDDYPGT